MLKNPLSAADSSPITSSDASKIKAKLMITDMHHITQFSSFVWDFNKYRIGQVISVDSACPTPWFAKIVAVLAQKVHSIVVQAVIKIQWFEIAIPETSAHPARYKLDSLCDIISPPSVLGHVLQVPDFDNPELFFIQPHFSRYYARYCPKT